MTVSNLGYVVPPMVQKLIQSPYQFHLTGSRFFQFNRPDSDWDFFVQYSFEVKEFIVGLGFEFVEGSDNKYTDFSNINIYRHPDGVDIQMVLDEKVKDTVQNFIKLYIPSNILKDKTLAPSIWNICFAAYDSGFKDAELKHKETTKE